MSSESENKVFASALKRNAEGSAKLVAKGHGELGRQIVSKAREHNVPIIQNLELSMRLSNIPLGETIPETIFVAVANLFGYILQLDEDRERIDNG
jgi:flagellar biosynthesis protein